MHIEQCERHILWAMRVTLPLLLPRLAASVQREDADAVDADEDLGDYAGGLCIVCVDADRSAILAPCGHVAMCR